MTTAIIGAGVAGLSVALRLVEAGAAPVIISRDFPSPFETVDAVDDINYASQWAGAHNRFWPPPANELDARDHELALRTYRRMEATAKAYPEAGITFMTGLEYLDEGVKGYEKLTLEKAREMGYEEFRFLAEGELPRGVKTGFEYRTWTLNPMVYCSHLLRRLNVAGCRFVKRDLKSVEEVFSMKDLGEIKTVINCSGTGFNDPNVFITRGQTCLVKNDAPLTLTRQYADGTWSFCVPRKFHGGTIIGGTKEPNDWTAAASPATRERLLRNFAETYPAILDQEGGRMTVLADIVGRRPTRKGGMRLEREDVAGGTVIHAYGLGGRGYEVSWGVAEAVFELMGKEVLSRL